MLGLKMPNFYMPLNRPKGTVHPESNSPGQPMTDQPESKSADQTGDKSASSEPKKKRSCWPCCCILPKS